MGSAEGGRGIEREMGDVPRGPVLGRAFRAGPLPRSRCRARVCWEAEAQHVCWEGQGVLRWSARGEGARLCWEGGGDVPGPREGGGRGGAGPGALRRPSALKRTVWPYFVLKRTVWNDLLPRVGIAGALARPSHAGILMAIVRVTQAS